MMASNGRSELASSLHADDRWLRDLARRMLRDTSLADDAAQATWMSVLRSPPKGELSRGFLRTALRNVIAKLRRGDSRREARERAVASAESIELGDVIEKMELRRVLLAAVLELEPIYRDVVLLRFHQDLTPTAIAERTGIPLATVKTRLRRAEEQLTERLDRRAGGDRRRYLAAFVATAEPTLRGAITTLIHGGIVMAMKQKLVAVAVAALVIVGGFALFERGSDVGVHRDRVEPDSENRAELEPPRLSDERSAEAPTERAAVDVEPSSPTIDTAAGTMDDTRIVEGVVCDVDGRVIPHARVAFERSVTPSEAKRLGRPRDPEVAADSNGRFSISVPRDASGSVVGVAPGIATLYSGTIQPRSQAVAPVVVLTKGVAIAGEVVDTEGRRVGGAEISLWFPDALKSRIPFPLENARQIWSRVEADAEGFFAFESLVPTFDGARLHTNPPGFLAFAAPIPSVDERGMRIVLERPAPHAKDRVRGQVVDPYGAPVAGADVILGAVAGVSDERGMFDIDATMAKGATVIRAVARGAQPGEVGWPLDSPEEFVVLTLGPPALSIRGWVRGASGEAVPRAVIQAADGVPLGFVAPHGILRCIEEQAGGYEHGVDTEANGAFELRGLSPRDYRLRIYLPQSGASWTTPPIAAGRTDVVIDLPGDLTIPVLNGRVVDRNGLPVQGVEVSISATRWECEYLGTRFASTSGAIGTATSSLDGTFALLAVPKQGATLSVDGDQIVGKSVQVPSDPARTFEITVARKRFLRLELDAPGTAETFGVLDDSGQPIQIRQEEDGGVRIAHAMPLDDGRSAVTIVADNARTIVLHADSKELRRIEIEFAKDGVTVVR